MSVDLGHAKGYIELDTSSLQSSCRDVTKELQKVDRQSELMRSELIKSQEGAKKLAGSCTSLGQSFNQVKERSKQLTIQINESKNKMEIYKQGIAGLNNYISQCKSKQKDLKLELEKSQQQYDKSKEKLDKLGETLGKNSDEYKRASQNLYEHQSKISQLGQNYMNLSEEIEASEDKVKQFKTQINYTEKEISELSRQISINESRFVVFGNTLQANGDKIKAYSQKVNSLGNALTIGVSVPLTAVGTATVKMAMDAETSFAKVSTVVDETALSYTKMKKDVTDVSNKTGVAITKFNGALYDTISAGVDSANAIGFTTNMVKLAKGGFTEVGNAVDVVTTSLNAYGLEAEEATNISDKLITTQNLGKTTVDELSSSLGKVIPTAKNVNINFDNVSTSMAVLTKNGIATAEATTYYNAMLNELGKSGTIADKTLKQLTHKGFADLIKSGSNMTDILSLLQQEANKSGKSLADMFGSAEASKAALTLMKNDGAEYNQILKQMQNSAGATEKAFQKMNNTEFEKFNRELNKLKNAGIQAGSKLLPVVSKGVELVGDLAEAFSELSPEQQEAIVKAGMLAVALGPVTKGIGGIINVAGSATKGVGKLFEKLGNVNNLKKATGSVSTLSSVLGGINPVAGAVTTSVLAVGAGVAYAMNQAKKATIKADLESRFGSIKLSAEEVEDIAKRLTTNEFTMKIDATIEAKEKLKEFELSIQEAVDNIRRTEWKIDIGLELTEEEKSSYKSSIEKYISQTQQYIQQQHYTATLAIDAILTPNTDSYNQIKNMTDRVYNGINKELDKLGRELAEVTNKAWEDNFLSKDELKLINQKKEEINKVLEEISQAEYEVKMDNIKADVTKEGLDVNSFKNLSKQINENIKERIKEIEKVEYSENVALKLSLNRNEINQDEFDKSIDIIKLKVKEKLNNIELENINFKLNTISDNYNDVLKPATEKLEKEFNDAIQLSASNVDSNLFWSKFTYNFRSAYENSALKGVAKDSLNQLITEMRPDEKSLEEIARSYYELGLTPPKETLEGLQNIEKKQALTGEIDNIYFLMADQISKSPEYQKVISNAVKNGNDIPNELAETLKNNYGLVFNATTGMFENMNKVIDSEKLVTLSKLYETGVSIDDSISNGLLDNIQVVRDETSGVITEIRDSAGNTIKNITPQFCKYLTDMMNKGLVRMNDKSKNYILDAPDVQVVNMIDSIQAGLNAGQYYLNNNPLNVRVTTAISSAALAGINAIPRARSFYNSSQEEIPTRNMFKELNDSYVNDEIIIARNNEYRTLSASYGYQKQLQETESFNIINTLDIDYSKLATSICTELRENPIKTNVTVNAPDINLSPQINLNGKSITDEVLQNVDKHLGKVATRKHRGW